MNSRAVWVAVFILVLTGCSSGTPTATPTGPSSPHQTATAPPTDSPRPTATPGPTPTPRPTPTPDPYPSNYWDETELRVGVSANLSSQRNYTALVETAASYWTHHSEQFAGYPINFTVVPNGTNPDIVVRFQREIRTCGGEETAAAMGCATHVSREFQPDRPEIVKIKAGYSAATTVETIQHEFGHLLGLDHGDEPMPLMNASADTYAYLSRPNITDRTYPWYSRNLSIYVAASPGYMGDETRSQVQHAVDYFRAGKGGVKPANVSLSITENKSDAQIVINFTREMEDGVSFGRGYGYNIDTDTPLEYRTYYVITIADIDDEAVGWHVGYWLSFALGIDKRSNLPDPFLDADYEDRRDEWWES